MKAIIKEVALQKDYLGEEIVTTIYFGGGTPSLLHIDEIKLILETIQSVFTVSKNREITFEVNPDNITEENLLLWKNAGINRLSIGVQSFFEEDLNWMNRAHTAKEAIESVQSAKKYFDNITIDLIYGLPDLTDEKWKENIEKAISLKVPHLSCYALTVEPRTPLEKMIRQHKKEDVNPDKQSDQFLLLMQMLSAAGYEHYEISNFAKPGWRSQHNSSYWQGTKYLGLGPSAHSFNGIERQWNIANNNLYITSINNNKIPFDREVLTDIQLTNEYIMTSLRTMEGIQIENPLFSLENRKEELLKKSEKYIKMGLLEKSETGIVLTMEGKLLADGIAADLFF